MTKKDVALKRKLLERMERPNEEFKESHAGINNVVQDIVNAIQESVGILAQTIRRSSDQVAGCFPQNYYQNTNCTTNSQREEEQLSLQFVRIL